MKSDGTNNDSRLNTSSICAVNPSTSSATRSATDSSWLTALTSWASSGTNSSGTNSSCRSRSSDSAIRFMSTPYAQDPGTNSAGARTGVT